jgi:hypothetical protein
MSCEIKISFAHGFAAYWTLVVATKTKKRSFYLGQDLKFCDRVLKMPTSYIIEMIGTNDIAEGTSGNKKLAKFICDTLKINGRNLHKFDSGQFCSE